jgi:uncharacterized protein
MAGRSFVHLEIPAQDRAAAAEFYGKLFGWSYEHIGPPMNYTTFSTGNFGGGFPDLSEMYKPGDIVPYVESENIEADLAQVEQLGGKSLLPRTEIPGMGWFAMFSDPTGNRMALYTPMMGQQA